MALGDTDGRDCEHAKQIAQVVRNLVDIQGFILVMKGTDNRFSDFLKEQMILFNEMFGQSFWHNVAIEMSFWKHNPTDILDRKEDQKMDEKKKERELNHKVQKLFSSVPEIPVIFIDPVFKEERAKGNETEIFRKETSKLWDIINTNQSYSCDSLTCKDVGFTEGIPKLVNLGPVLSRVGGKLALTWQIWFGECGNQTGIRSYSIEFTNSKSRNVQIFSMIDKQQKKQEVFIAKEPSKHLGFPSTGIVMDKCSKTTLDNECDNNNSKYKTVTLVFNKIDDENFGNYSAFNAVGRSKDVEVRKVIDGTWGEWSMYCPCSKTCFSLKENRWGEKVRNRECTEQQNGGNPCTGRDREVMQCAHGPGESVPRNCIGVFNEWSTRSHCDRTCGGGVMRRRRHCGEAACKIDKAGRGDEDEKACNIQECPVPSVYGEWSQWKCKEVCHNPYERHLTREVRTRQCIVKYPEHEAANCKLMTHTREESQRPCSNIEQCPALFEITTEVCGETHSGTDANVFIKFKNGVKGSCTTNWLDDYGDDFETSKYQIWRNPFLFS